MPIPKVEALIREGLLARYQAYHAKGWPALRRTHARAAVRPGNDDELSIATKQSKLVAKYLLRAQRAAELPNHPVQRSR